MGLDELFAAGHDLQTHLNLNRGLTGSLDKIWAMISSGRWGRIWSWAMAILNCSSSRSIFAAVFFFFLYEVVDCVSANKYR